MFNKLNHFKEQGYILVTRVSRQDAIYAIQNVLDYYPKFNPSLGDDSSYRKQFECFFQKLKQIYPQIFLMDMYGIKTLWKYIQSYKDESLNDMGTQKAAIHIYEIICYLYEKLPTFKSLNEMPTLNLEEQCESALATKAIKEGTKDHILKKVESGALLLKDISDGRDAYSIRKYYTNIQKELEREYILNNYNRCEFEVTLLQKCHDEIAKCNASLVLTIGTGIDNAFDLSKSKKEQITSKSTKDLG